MKINGPINIIRLEGTIFNIKKIIYIYFDHHYPLNKQTKCDGYLNDDIVTFLNKEFLKIHDKTIDFFMETSFDQEEELLKNIHYKDRYIDEVNKFFISNILVKNNKNLGTKINKNIRFHYIDIRYEFKTISFSKIFNHMKNNIENNKDNKEFINKIIFELNNLKTILKNEDNKIIYKLKNKYIHNEIKNKMNILLDKVYKDIDKLKIEINSISTINQIDTTYLKLLQLYSWLMDIYFLRRFLDKNYVNNAIIYCGSGHAIRYIYFLIKNFDFKITNASFLNKPIGLVNEILRYYEEKDDIDNDTSIIHLFNNKTNIQCIDISTFPENFS
jgi:hypothetical protein